MKKIIVGMIAIVFVCFTFYGLQAKENKQEPVEEQAKAVESENLTHLVCFQKGEQKYINFIIDIENEKVIEPEEVKWGELRPRTLNLWVDKEQPEFFYIEKKTGSMQICRNDYVSNMCGEYQCYKMKTEF